MPASQLLNAWAQMDDNRHSRSAISDDRGAHTYGKIANHARAIAASLNDARRGDERIGILVSPGASFVASLVGAWLSDACVVILSPLHPSPETAYFLEDAHVRTILASKDLAVRLDDVKGDRVVVDPDSLADSDAFDVSRVPNVDAPALQLYTSGTTGKPKGAVLTHANLEANTAILENAWGITKNDRLLHTLPLHHTHGLVVALLTTLRAGGHVTMHASFDAALIWNDLAHATTFMAVPTIYSKLFAAFDSADEITKNKWMQNARHLRLATSGSAALPVTLAERWREITGKIPLERYGMTEIGMALSNSLDGDRFAGCVGKPLPTVETKIAGSENEGELWIRGPSVFAGYFNRDAATRESFAPSDDGGAPWFMTGDTVRRDERGVFKILGRTSIDILKSGGYKLSALEIEEVIRDHEAVSEVAVVGVPDAEWGDRVVACIVANKNSESDVSTDKIRAFCKEKLAAYKVPKDAFVFDTLPRNAMGKVVKAELVKSVSERLRKP
jgi:malonyl-CoA/methylmalonyl-CoA synthetase